MNFIEYIKNILSVARKFELCDNAPIEIRRAMKEALTKNSKKIEKKTKVFSKRSR